MAGDNNKDYVVLGVITGAHGIRGAVKVKSFTEQPAAIADYGVLHSDAGDMEFKSLKPAKAGFIAEFKGISDRNRAETLTGLELRLPRAALPLPDDNEFYHADLIGLTAKTMDGEIIGVIKAIHDFGAGDLLEIAASGNATIEWVPFTRKNIPNVDIAGGYVRVVLEEADE